MGLFEEIFNRDVDVIVQVGYFAAAVFAGTTILYAHA